MSGRRFEDPLPARASRGWTELGAIALACTAATARGEHFDKGSYVPAMEACSPGAANTTTSDGLPACAPARFRSSCETDPVGARRLGARGRGEYVVRPTGAELTRGNGGEPDIVTKFDLQDVRTCGGAPAGGTLNGLSGFRMTRDDAACAGAVCRLPEITVTHEVPCDGASCELRQFANDILEATGDSPLALAVAWTAEVTSFDVLDAGGRSFLTPGVALLRSGRGDAPPGFAVDADQWEARMVPAFVECRASDVNTTSDDGRPACAGAPPTSDCAVDPVHAIHVEPESRFRKATYTVRGGVLLVHLRAGRLYDCAGEPYQGSLTLATFIRATLQDGSCTGGLCTAVDQRFVTSVDADNGRLDASAVVLGLGPRTSYASLEILRAELQDASGNAVVSGHGFLVRCTPRGFCFGD